MVRKANYIEAEAIFDLIRFYAEQGIMLPRTLEDVQDHCGEFFVYERNGGVIAACHMKYGWDNLAEIRSLAVHPDYYRKGIGTQLIRDCMDEALNEGMEGVFVLTYVTSLFEKMGFQVIPKSALPLKVWEDCMGCHKRNHCDEIALLIPLHPSVKHHSLEPNPSELTMPHEPAMSRIL